VTQILYVDDESDLLELGRIYLENNGFTVKTSESAINALELLKTKQFDAIVSDYQMPQMDGIEFLKIVHRDHKKTPFIMFTGKGREEIAIKAFENGASSYIQKGGEPRSQFAELSHKIQDAVDICNFQEKFTESEERYRRLFETAQDGIIILNEDGKIIDANPFILDLTGNTIGEMVGKQLFEIGLIRDASLSKLCFEKLKKDGYIRYDNLPLKIKNGGCAEVEFVSNEYSVNHSRVIQCNIRDITQRNKSLRDSNANLKKYRVVFDLFPMGITISDEAGNIIESNNTAEKLLGLSKEEQEQRKIDGEEWRVIRPDGSPMPPEEFPSVKALKENRTISNIVLGIVKKDNKITWINVTAVPIKVKGYGVAIIYDDVFKNKTTT
jgi:PAS domain S-box-containing protein